LYNNAVPDKSSKEAKSLASSLYYLSTQFELKSAENTGLRTSLEAKKKHKVKDQVLPQLTNDSGALTLSPATAGKALEALARRDQEKEEELAKKASSKAARQAAKVNRLALQQAAAEKREVDRNRREKEKKDKAQKLAQRKRERERKLGLSHHPQRRGNKPSSQDQTGPPRSKQSGNLVAVHRV
jgi:hypothetical protein